MEANSERLKKFVITSEFIRSACELPKEYGHKILKALNNCETAEPTDAARRAAGDSSP